MHSRELHDGPMHGSVDVADQVVRVCESSLTLGCGTACRYHETLANVTVEPGKTVNVRFTCPAAETAVNSEEYGGAYSLYRAMAFGPDGASKLPDVCASLTPSCGRPLLRALALVAHWPRARRVGWTG